MAAVDIDAYLADVPEPGRATLEEVRRRILAERDRLLEYPAGHVRDRLAESVE